MNLKDLVGVWKCNDGGSFTITELENVLGQKSIYVIHGTLDYAKTGALTPYDNVGVINSKEKDTGVLEIVWKNTLRFGNNGYNQIKTEVEVADSLDRMEFKSENGNQSPKYNNYGNFEKVRNND